MARQMAFCVDEVSARNPELIGLEGERIDAQEWLNVFTTGKEARDGVTANSNIEETWVISCDDIEPINLAATIKSDAPHRCVRLVAGEVCGSLYSRASTAHIDEVFELRALPQRYAEKKRALYEQSATTQCFTRATVQENAVLEKPHSSQAIQLRNNQAHPSFQSSLVTYDSRAFVLTVVSGSGGAGKSSTSALSAVVAHKMGYRTLLLDCDLQFGDVATMVGEKKPLCLDELTMNPSRIETEVVNKRSFSVLAAPTRLEASEEVVQFLPSFFGQLTSLFDVIVVNTGASWAEQHAILLERSSVALFLIDQRASSVHACRHALELCARCGIAANPFQFALNRCMKGAPLTSMDVSCALQDVSVYELKEGGRDVEDYLSAGGAADLVSMGNEFAKSIENLMGQLLPDNKRHSADYMLEETKQRSSRRRNRRFSRKQREQLS